MVHGWHTHRHFRMALSAVARRVLSEGTGAARRTVLRIASLPQHRIERLVLFVANPAELRTLARADAARIRVRGEGPALHHAYQTAARHRRAAGEFLRLRRVRTARKIRAVALAVPRQLQVRP